MKAGDTETCNCQECNIDYNVIVVSYQPRDTTSINECEVVYCPFCGEKLDKTIEDSDLESDESDE